MVDPGVLRALAEEAENATVGTTAAPWAVEGGSVFDQFRGYVVSVGDLEANGTGAASHNVEFIAWARTAVPEFARLARGAAERIDTLEAEVAAWERWSERAEPGPHVPPSPRELRDLAARPRQEWTFIAPPGPPIPIFDDAPAVSPVPEPRPKAECAECGGTRTVIEVSMDRVRAGIGGPRPWRRPCPSCAVPEPKAEGDPK